LVIESKWENGSIGEITHSTLSVAVPLGSVGIDMAWIVDVGVKVGERVSVGEAEERKKDKEEKREEGGVRSGKG
jgi:hypothetical protein